MRVLVAVLSPLMRARTEHAMRQIPDAQVVGSVRDARQAAELVGGMAPDLCLCDAQMYPDLAAALSTLPATPRAATRLILLVSRSQSVGPALPSGISALLPVDLPAAELAEFLQTMVDTDPVVPEPTRPIQSPDRPSDTGLSITSSSSPRSPLRGGWRPTSGAASLSPVDRRQVVPDDRAVFRQVGSEQGQQRARDPVTDPPSLETLRIVADRVQDLGYPFSVVVCSCQFAPGSVVPTDLTTYNRLLRHLAGTVRLAVREYDLVCRVGGMTFAVLLPGTPEANTGVVATRLADAVAALEVAELSHGTGLRVTMATGGWDPSEAPLEVFDRTLASLASMSGGIRPKAGGN